MEYVGVGLAIPGVIELCLKYGNHLYQRYQDFHNAEDDIRVRILEIEGHWLQIEEQIKYMPRIWQELHDRLQIHFNHVLSRLYGLLLKATSMLDTLIAPKTTPKARIENKGIFNVMKKEGKLRRGIFALGKKDALDSLIAEIRTWHQDMLGPSWFQLLRVPEVFTMDTKPQPPLKAEQVVQLQNMHKGIKAAEADAIGSLQEMLLPNSAIRPQRTQLFASSAALGSHTADGAAVLIDAITLPPDLDLPGTKINFCRLARKLSTAYASSFGLLQCIGVLATQKDSTSRESLSLLFRMPTSLGNPRSLREILIERNEHMPLQVRLSIAAQLARAVMSIHSLKIVHKNIRPETILILTTASEQSPTAFVLGFEQFRPVDMESLRRGDVMWQKAIYRHPSRHGLHLQTNYSMQHDIYSLGVCLLELGLWRSFILNPAGAGSPDPQLDTSRMAGKETWRKALVLKERLQELARQELPARMGKKYSDVVSACLSCLDRGNVEFGDEDDFDDKDDILVSVRYMENVLLQLREISV